MSYELTTEKKDGYLKATVSGTRSFETVLAFIKDVLTACTKEEAKKLLVDLRAFKGQIDTLEAFMIPDKYFPELEYRKVLARCAIIDLGEYKDRGQFFENVAVNRGFPLRFFREPDEAVQWLLS